MVGVGPSQGNRLGCFCTHPPNTSLLVPRDVPAGLHRGFLLSGSKKVQDATPPRAGGLADRPVRIPPVPAGRKAPDVWPERHIAGPASSQWHFSGSHLGSPAGRGQPTALQRQALPSQTRSVLRATLPSREKSQLFGAQEKQQAARPGCPPETLLIVSTFCRAALQGAGPSCPPSSQCLFGGPTCWQVTGGHMTSQT